jgi:hypothetical protein
MINEPRIGRGIGGEALPGRLHSLENTPFDGDFGDPSLFHLFDELGVLHRSVLLLPCAELIEHRHQHQGYDQPDRDVLDEIIQNFS